MPLTQVKQPHLSKSRGPSIPQFHIQMPLQGSFYYINLFKW